MLLLKPLRPGMFHLLYVFNIDVSFLCTVNFKESILPQKRSNMLLQKKGTSSVSFGSIFYSNISTPFLLHLTNRVKFILT